jgi:F-type H+-transporting ATPase subunit b
MPRDQKLKQWNAEREAAIEDVRQATQQRTLAAKQEIEQSAASARTQIDAMSAELSSRILSAVLPAGIKQPEEVAQ